MSKIAILTDSSCDIPQELAEKYGIDIMGFHILLDDEDIVEREKYTPEEFYDKMRAAKGIPSTAAITPIQFCEKYCQYVDEGYTDVIHVPINRSGSSTYNNAVMAQGMLREERPEHHLNIHLLDPHTYSMVFGWYLCEMARKLQNGAELRHVISEFETQMNKMEVILGPYSLKQMKKSGRISAAAAVMGELMGIRPIITLIDGKTRVESKVRGDDKVIPAMIDLCKKRTEGGGVLINQALHTLDLLQWFCGFPSEVYANCENYLHKRAIEVEDTVTAVFKGEANFDFFATSCAASDLPVTLELKTENGAVVLLPDCAVANGKTLAIDESRTYFGKCDYGHGHNSLIADFYSCVSRGEEFWINGEEGAKVVKLILAVYESNGKEVKIGEA